MKIFERSYDWFQLQSIEPFTTSSQIQLQSIGIKNRHQSVIFKKGDVTDATCRRSIQDMVGKQCILSFHSSLNVCATRGLWLHCSWLSTCMSRLQPHSHAYLFCLLPYNFSSKRETVHSLH